MSTDAIARRKASRQQNRANESKSATAVPSSSKEISWTKTLNYEDQQEQMLREMFANKGRLWSVLKNDDRDNSVTPLSRRFRGLPTITVAPKSGRLPAMVDAGTAFAGLGDAEVVKNRTASSTEASDRRQPLSDQEFSNFEDDDKDENNDDKNENEECLDSPDESPEKSNESKPESESVVKPPETKRIPSRVNDLPLVYLSGDVWPPNPTSCRRSELMRSGLHRAFKSKKETANERISWRSPKFTRNASSLVMENDNDNNNYKLNNVNNKQHRPLRRIDIQPVNDETASDEVQSDVAKLSAVETSKKGDDLEEATRLVDALTLEVMASNRRHDILLEEFEAFKEKTRKEVGALQEAVTLLATHLRLKPVIRQTENLNNEMSIEVQGHSCVDRSSTTTDATDNSDSCYGDYDSGVVQRDGAFVDRDSILDKLQNIQRLEQESAANNSRNDQ